MKKLLLLAISIFIGAGAYAQFDTTYIAVGEIIQPEDTIWIDWNSTGDPLYSFEVTLRNNDTLDWVGVGGVLDPQLLFTATLDGTPVTDPDGGGWVRQLSISLPAGGSVPFILTQSYLSTGPTGVKNLCISLQTVINTPTGGLFINADANAQLCKDLIYADGGPNSVQEIDLSTFEKVYVQNGTMFVSATSLANDLEIQVISVTGQLLKSEKVASSGAFSREINVSDLEAGMYIVALKTKSGSVVATKVFIN